MFFTLNLQEGDNEESINPRERSSLFRLDSQFEDTNDANFKVFAERFGRRFVGLKNLPSPEPSFTSLEKTYPSHRWQCDDDSSKKG